MRASLPVVVGYAAIGFAFGVVAGTAGLRVPEVTLMSLILYAGSAQFVMAGLLGAGAPAVTIIATVFLVNLRHFLYSAALVPYLRRLPVWQNTLIAAELTDETFAVATGHLAQGRRPGAGWFYGLNITAQAAWVIATTLGAIAGSAVPDARALGLDFALPAMFAALLVLQIAARSRVHPALWVAVTAAAIAVGGAMVIPASWAIIAATLVAAGVGVAIEGEG